MLARLYAARLAELKRQLRAAAHIARMYRGLAGRVRHARKRMLVEAAKGAALVVHVKQVRSKNPPCFISFFFFSFFFFLHILLFFSLDNRLCASCFRRT